jgi:hypothetical protein
MGKNNELSKKIFFEKTYTIIYKSQIQLLWLLTRLPIKWDDIFKNYYPETMRNYPYDKYIYFLKNNGLIELIPPDAPYPYVSITPLGKEFLEYLKTSNYTGEEKNNL